MQKRIIVKSAPRIAVPASTLVVKTATATVLKVRFS